MLGANKPLFGSNTGTAPLFGQQQNMATNQNTGGLFGNMANNTTFTQNTQGNSLFGNTNQNQGIFGGGNNPAQQNMNTGGGLFGQPQQTQQTQQIGLFGNPSQNLNQGGIFGNSIGQQDNNAFNQNQNQNQNQNSIFGMNNNLNTNLGNNVNQFGMQNNVLGGNKPTMGLFGGQNNNAVGGGVFGQNTQQTNSIFGGGLNQTNNTLGGNQSLFGQTPINNAQQGMTFGNTPTNFGVSNTTSNSLFGANNNTGNIGNNLTAPSFGINNNLTSNNTFGNNAFGNTTNTNTLGFQNTMNNTGKSLFGTNLTPTNPTFNTGMGNMGNLGGMGNMGLNTLGNNLNMKKFQPSKPRNQTLTKEKNALVACITTTDQFHSFSKQELRIQYILSGGQMPQGNTPAFNAPSFGLGGTNQTNLLSSPNPNLIQTNTNKLFGNSPVQQNLNNTAMTLFAQNQPSNTNTFGNTANTSIFGQQPQQNQPTLFGQTNNTLLGGQSNQTSLFGGNTGLNTSPLSQTNAQTSIFGQQTQQNQTPLFGQAAGTSLFGNNLLNNNSLLNTQNNQIQPNMNDPNKTNFPNFGDSMFPMNQGSQGFGMNFPFPDFAKNDMFAANPYYNKNPFESFLNSYIEDPIIKQFPVPAGYELKKKKLQSQDKDPWEQLKEKTLDKMKNQKIQTISKKKQNLFEDSIKSQKNKKIDQSSNFLKIRDKEFRQYRQIRQDKQQDDFDMIRLKYIKKPEGKNKLILEDVQTDNYQTENLRKKQKSTNQLVQIDALPVCTKFTLNPSLVVLARSHRDQLKAVKNLKISNQFGMIELLQPVNLLNVNIDQLITIEQDSIEILNLGNFKVDKNKAILTFNNFGKYEERMKKNPQIDLSVKKEKFMKKMKNWMKEAKMTLIEFNQNNCTLKVQV